MQLTTLVFMVLVLGILWGGFAALLMHSMKSDKGRPAAGADATPEGGNDD